MSTKNHKGDYRRVKKETWDKIVEFYPGSGPEITMVFAPGKDPNGAATGFFDTSSWVVHNHPPPDDTHNKKKKKKKVRLGSYLLRGKGDQPAASEGSHGDDSVPEGGEGAKKSSLSTKPKATSGRTSYMVLGNAEGEEKGDEIDQREPDSDDDDLPPDEDEDEGNENDEDDEDDSKVMLNKRTASRPTLDDSVRVTCLIAVLSVSHLKPLSLACGGTPLRLTCGLQAERGA
jgi:hypothetical protein